MAFLEKYKTTIITLLLLGGLYFVYVTYFQGTNIDILSSSQVGAVDGTAAGNEIILILNEVQGIKLNTTLFEDEPFRALIDFKEDIIPENVGRANPFEPIGFGLNTQGVIAEPNPIDVQVITPRGREIDIEPSS